MDGRSFKAVLRALGKTQVEFAEEIGVALRTVHYWASKGPPSEVAYLLDLLAAYELPFGPPSEDGRVPIQRPLETQLNRLLAAAGDSRRDEAIDAIERWLIENRKQPDKVR
jgi:transcriptional regulator with XRE-family HTH domain